MCLPKSECYSPGGQYGDRPADCPIGVLRDADGAALPLCYGLNVCNIPVGTDEYVQTYLAEKAHVVVSNVNKISFELTDNSNEAWCLLYYSSAHQWDYWATHAYPRDSLGPSAIVDAALLGAAERATGVGLSNNQDAIAAVWRRRLRLPARLRGGGIRAHVETAAASFVGSVNQALPRLIDHTDAAGGHVAGLLPSLSGVLGAGSFDEGSESTRYTSYLSSGLVGATELRSAWDALRVEAGGDLDEECPLSNAADGARGSQRDLTGVVEARRFTLLDADVAALPRDDHGALFARVAWCSVDKASAVWVSAIPTRHLRAGPAEFREICAAYFGAPSPVASSLAGRGIFGNSGARRGTCDRFGLKLASARLDDRWTRAHDEVKDAIAHGLDHIKVNYMCEVIGVFSPVIPPMEQAAARRYMRGQRAGHQGLVPDFKVALPRLVDGAAATDALAELKLVRCGSTTAAPIGGSTYPTSGPHDVFAGRQRAVEWRESKIQVDRERDARLVDSKFCGTQGGEDGPVLLRLRSFGPIVGLVVGHFGEWSDGLYRLVGAAADDAAPRMRAMWGARTDEDSRNRCAAYLRREIAWAGLNANARLKLERAEFVGWDARSAAARRAGRAGSEHARRERCAWASAAYEAPRQGPSAGHFPRARDAA